MENFERKHAPIEIWSCFIDILAFELGKLCQGAGDFVSVFPTCGLEFCTEKLCPGWGF